MRKHLPLLAMIVDFSAGLGASGKVCLGAAVGAAVTVAQRKSTPR